MRKIYLGKCLEDNNLTEIRKDLDKNNIEEISGTSEKESILIILSKYGVTTHETSQHEKLFSGSAGENKSTMNVNVNVWGTGTPMREFMYSLDMAEACVYIMQV
jgi:GDP-L-fucose synthase